MTDKEPVVVQKPSLLTAPALLPSSSKPSLHSENHEEVEAYDAREDGSEREAEHSIADSNSQIEEPDFSAAYTIPTTLRVAILCRHWNGFEGSCARLDTCNFKHSTQFSVKEPCRNWRQNGSCQYGQNCNYFHPIEKPYAVRSDEGSTKSSPRPLAHPLPGKKKQNETSAISNHTTSREDLLAGASGGRWSHNRDSRSTISGGSHSHGGLASPRDREDAKWARARNERNERMLEKNKLNNRSHEDREGSRSHSNRDNSLTMGTSTSNNSSSQNLTMHPVTHRHSVSAGDHASRESESHDFAEDTASRRESFYGGAGSRPGSTSSSMSRDTTSAYNALFSITINNAIYNSSLPNNTNSNISPRQSISAPSHPLSPRSSPISQQYLKSSLSGSSSSETTSLHNMKNNQLSKSNSSHYSSGSLERSGGNHNNRKDSRQNNTSNTNTSSHSRSDSESNNILFRSSNSSGNTRTERNVANFSNSTGFNNATTNAMAPEPVKKTLRQNPLYKKNAKQNKPLVLGFGR